MTANLFLVFLRRLNPSAILDLRARRDAGNKVVAMGKLYYPTLPALYCDLIMKIGNLTSALTKTVETAIPLYSNEIKIFLPYLFYDCSLVG